MQTWEEIFSALQQLEAANKELAVLIERLRNRDGTAAPLISPAVERLSAATIVFNATIHPVVSSG